MSPPTYHKSHLLPIRPWHTIDKNLDSYQVMVRELFLMAMIIRRDWTSNDTTNEQDHELNRIHNQIKRIAKRLYNVFEPPAVGLNKNAKETGNKGTKAVVQSRKKARKKANSKKTKRYHS
jgi:hypothetical protein